MNDVIRTQEFQSAGETFQQFFKLRQIQAVIHFDFIMQWAIAQLQNNVFVVIGFVLLESQSVDDVWMFR